MSVLLSPEFRLAFALVLNALTCVAAWRFARRWEGDRLSAASDTLLLDYLVQYLSVCIPGLIGALHPLTIALVAVLLSAVMLAMGMKKSVQARGFESAGVGRATLFASAFFVLAYLASLVWFQRIVPIVSNDALTYHMPAAVQWLQTGRLSFYEAWFYNPANSYSPLGGSACIAWLIAPMGNDVIARFVQAGPLVFLFVAMINLLRALGPGVMVSAILAAACVLVRTYISQTILAKDDLFVAAIFVVLIESLRRERVDTPIGPWRVGIALGLLLATKFTVLLSLPIVLLMLGRGWTWRRAAIAIGVTLLIAGPWYLRNLILVHNPLYPASVPPFPGMLHLVRSKLLATPRSVWDIFTNSYYAIPPQLAGVMIAGWAAAIAIEWRTLWRDRLKRTCLLGPVIGIAIFVLKAPYGEMRFAYPALLLLFAAGAIAIRRLPQIVQLIAAIALALWAALTAFSTGPSGAFTIVSIAVALVGFGIGFIQFTKRRLIIAGAAAIAILTGAVYVQWNAYVEGCEEFTDLHWDHETAYPDLADVWHYVRSEMPRGSKIAYANTYFTYPLMGYSYDHRVVYVPTRRDVERFIDMPEVITPTTGEEITGHIEHLLRADPDRDAWMRRLRDSGAQYLVVLKKGPSAAQFKEPAPELTFASADPAHFQRVYDSEGGSVYRIVW